VLVVKAITPTVRAALGAGSISTVTSR